MSACWADILQQADRHEKEQACHQRIVLGRDGSLVENGHKSNHPPHFKPSSSRFVFNRESRDPYCYEHSWSFNCPCF